MAKLSFKITNNELTDKEINKVNVLGKAYWLIYLLLCATSLGTAFYFIDSFSQYLYGNLAFVFYMTLLVSGKFIISDDYRKTFLKPFQKKNVGTGDILAAFVIGSIMIAVMSFLWPIIFAGHIMTPFGYIPIIKKKLKDNSDFTLRLNGTEIYKQNEQLHRDLQMFDGKSYYLPALVKRQLPSLVFKDKPQHDFFEKDFNGQGSHKWYYMGEKQDTPELVWITSQHVEGFKEEFTKKRLKIINQNF